METWKKNVFNAQSGEVITYQCPYCGRVANKEHKYCPYCGKELASSDVVTRFREVVATAGFTVDEFNQFYAEHFAPKQVCFTESKPAESPKPVEQPKVSEAEGWYEIPQTIEAFVDKYEVIFGRDAYVKVDDLMRWIKYINEN